VSEPFLGELRLMSFTFARKGWAQCNGQLLPINQNQAPFSLLGTTYGGNGQTTSDGLEPSTPSLPWSSARYESRRLEPCPTP
jgi:microcystin-dependent protein